MNKKILVIDDDKDILDAIQILLEIEKYTVLTSAKGEEVYTLINDFKPDLILLDVLISGNDGRIICKKIKENMLTKKIPVVLMSAHPSVVKDYVSFGANDFLAKPFETEDLLGIIQKNLR